MNKLKKFFTIILLFFCFYFLFSYSYILNKSVIEAINLWVTKVFPTLFIMFILNDIIISSNILSILNNLIAPFFNKIFKTSGSSTLTFILTIFSGTPSSAFIIKEMLFKKQIILSDANKLIAFTFFGNPLFLYNILNITFNKFITIKIILIHYLANIIIGLFFRGINSNEVINKEKHPTKDKNIFVIIPSAITKSFNTLLMILGTITFYMIITNFIINIIPFNNFMEVILKGILEITQGLNNLSTFNSTSIIKEIIALSIISFGGLSIHTQILSLINDTKISYKNFLIGRILHVLISTSSYLFITYIIIG